MSEFAVYLIIGAVTGAVLRIIYDARPKKAVGNTATASKPKYWYYPVCSATFTPSAKALLRTKASQ